MYLLRTLCPRTDIRLGRHGFSIELPAFWPDWVERSGLTQEKVDYKIANQGNAWLDACGFDGMYDPDSTYFDTKAELRRLGDKQELGPNARRLYEARTAIRAKWGVWGIEHLEVPGNACGLDLDSCPIGRFLERGAMLTPHNIDSTAQKMLLLIVFASFAEDIVVFSRKG